MPDKSVDKVEKVCYVLGKPFWDNTALHARGDLLYFPEGGQPKSARKATTADMEAAAAKAEYAEAPQDLGRLKADLEAKFEAKVEQAVEAKVQEAVAAALAAQKK